MPYSSVRRVARYAGIAPFAVAIVFAASASAASTPTGGSGIGAATTKAKPKPKAKTEVKVSATQSKTNNDPSPAAGNPVTAPVKQDGGSQHLGERTLRQGMKGHDVRVLQGYLTVAGFPTSIDGAFGPATKASVVAFEQAHKLTANGVVTYAQSRVLRQVVAAAPAAPAAGNVGKATPIVGGAVGRATINSNGTATAPADAPPAVKAVIASANRIIDKPYIYAGGHASWNAPGYDCSGAVSYALHGGGLLSAPLAVQFEGYGAPGPGRWITVYADSQHVFAVIAGRAFDTADFGGPNIPAGTGPRWRSNPTGNLADGGDYVVRHPPGL